jgi:hypothetical protein
MLTLKACKQLYMFRTSFHNISIEPGRYDNTHREDRVGKSCNMGKNKNEYHFLIVCFHYRDLRIKLLNPTMSLAKHF